MSQQSTPNDDLLFARLRDALRIADPYERGKTARREFELLLKAVNHTAPPRKKRGKSPPDVDAAVVVVLGPMLEAVLPYSPLLGLSVTTIRRLKPDQTIELKQTPVQLESGETVILQPDEDRLTLTSQGVRALKQWKGLRIINVLRKVQDAIGKRVSGLQEELKRVPDTRSYQKQRNDIQKQLAELEDIIHRDEVRLSRHIRDAAIRFLLSVGLTWHEIPPCLVDKRQTWLGHGDRIRSFYDRQEVLLKYQGSDTAEEFEARHNAFLSSLKDLTN